MQKDSTGQPNGIYSCQGFRLRCATTYSRMLGRDCALQMSGIVCETKVTDNSAKLQCTL